MSKLEQDDPGLEIRVRKRRPLRPPFAPPRTLREVVRGGAFAHPERSVVLEGCRYERVSFAKVPFDYFGSLRSTFEGCDFTGSRLRGSLGLGVVDSVYRDCRFDKCDMRGIYPGPGHARFERCTFEDVRFRTFLAHHAEFVDCVFAGKMKGVTFWGHGLSDAEERYRNEFRGNDFTRAMLQDVDFVGGIDLRAQKLPRELGPEYVLLDRWPERAALARAEILRWPDLDERQDALELLEFYGDAPHAEQEQLLAIRDLLPFIPKSVSHRVWDLLERC